MKMYIKILIVTCIAVEVALTECQDNTVANLNLQSKYLDTLGVSSSAPEFNESRQLFERSNDYNEDCLRGCPRILDPICAVDEEHPQDYRYFHNACLMEYDSCRQGRAWKPTQMLLCIEDVDPVVRNDCMRACPLIYNPVCASDGKNYEIFGNQCSFGMENCLASGKWLEVPAEQCGL